jgi:hypothetical protein
MDRKQKNYCSNQMALMEASNLSPAQECHDLGGSKLMGMKMGYFCVLVPRLCFFLGWIFAA